MGSKWSQSLTGNYSVGFDRPCLFIFKETCNALKNKQEYDNLEKRIKAAWKKAD